MNTSTDATSEVATDVAPALEARAIVKRFEGVLALDGVNLSVQPGEIHALLGENGAGKSTLIRALTGVMPPDEGEILRDGKTVSVPNVRAANHLGVVALYQELSIIPTMSVAENIVLGERTPATAGIVAWKKLEAEAQRHLQRLNQRIPLRQLAGTLSPVKQTMVSVARALATDARVLILDEPTASLTDTEIRDLFVALRRLRDEGVAIIYVSHRLEEVFELCDRLTVMRNGATITTKRVADSSIEDVITNMVGRRQDTLFPERGTATDRPVLEVRGLSGRRVSDATFEARAGEVLGIGGLAGSGRSELLRLLAGAQKATGGTIAIEGTELGRIRNVGQVLAAGMALVPEERRSQGVMLQRSIQDNVALANLGAVSRIGVMSERAVSELAQSGIANLRIKTRGAGQPVGQLSGGNQQKVVLAKMLARKPKVLLMDEPTRGIDVGTKAEIYRLIRELAANGTTVVAVSSELPELIGMSDRILIMHEGRVSGTVAAEGADEELLLSYAYGRVEDDQH